MPVVASSAYDQAEDALNLARALMNDVAGVVFTDALLFPFLNSAYRELQRELAENGVNTLTEDMQLDLPLTNGVTPTTLSDVTTPQLPTDLVVPFMLWEQVTGSEDLFVPMEKVTGGLPNFQPSGYLRIWEWISDSINLVGATQPITVKIRYEKLLPQLMLGTDPIQIRASTDPLAYGVAALAARARGSRALAIDMASASEQAINQLIDINVRPEQYKGRRRMPYGYRRRIIYL